MQTHLVEDGRDELEPHAEVACAVVAELHLVRLLALREAMQTETRNAVKRLAS